MLKEFMRVNSLQLSECFAPITEACELLKNLDSKTELSEIDELSSKLNISQVKQICSLYMPLDPNERPFALEYVARIVSYLKERRGIQLEDKILLDSKLDYSIYIPYTYSGLNIESIDIPIQYTGFLNKI
jgi:hypothetical protein